MPSVLTSLSLVGVYNKDSRDWSNSSDVIHVERPTQSGDLHVRLFSHDDVIYTSQFLMLIFSASLLREKWISYNMEHSDNFNATSRCSSMQKLSSLLPECYYSESLKIVSCNVTLPTVAATFFVLQLMISFKL